MPITTVGVKDLNQAVKDLTREITRAGIAATATAAVFGTTMTRTAKLFNPAEAIRFEYRLRDLGAVVGSILQPSFLKLSDTVHKFSTYLLNMDDSTKKLINTFVSWTVPITAAAIAFGGLITVMRSFVTVGSAVWGIAKVVGGVTGLRGVASTAAAVGGATAAAVAGGAKAASSGAMNMAALSTAAAVAPGATRVGPTMGAVGGAATTTGGFLNRNKGRLIKGGLVAGGVASAVAMSGDDGESLTGSILSGGMTGGMLGSFGGPKGAAIGGLVGAITGAIKYAFSGSGSTGPQKSPDGMAPRDIGSFSSVLDPGRKLRMNSLATGGLAKMENDRSKDPADKLAAVLKAEAAANRGLWTDFINELKGEFGGRKTQ